MARSLVVEDPAILAINTDPEAPILSHADYAVVGDLHKVVPGGDGRDQTAAAGLGSGSPSRLGPEAKP
ncbi:MAG: hypothetical protein WEE66_08045 [Actinomycetota bacterium]